MKRVLGIGLTLFFAACVLFTTGLVEGSEKATVTYSKHVASILNKNCVAATDPAKSRPCR
jgi:hypothetical protein